MARADARTFFWKSGVSVRSTGTEKNARLPSKYSESSSRARSARRRAAALAGFSRRSARIRETPRGVAWMEILSRSWLLWRADSRAAVSTCLARSPASASGAKYRVRMSSTPSFFMPPLP